MNPNTGEMAFDVASYEMEKLRKRGFVNVPEDLIPEAEKLKKEGKDCFDLEDETSGLAKFAKELREKSPDPEGGDDKPLPPKPGERIYSKLPPPKVKKGHGNRKKKKRDVAKASRKMNRK